MEESVWDGAAGTAGGAPFGESLARLAQNRGLDATALAAAAQLPAALVEELMSGKARATTAQLARLALALKLNAIEFLQQSGILSLEVYAGGLDPLYFLPSGQIRYDARIYMREINPRHPVPERDMTKRNATLKALADDGVLDPLGRLEIELTYLLRAAVQATGGTL